MTTRIEIKNEGPGDVEVEVRQPDRNYTNLKKTLKPKDVDSFLYVYTGQEITVREK